MSGKKAVVVLAAIAGKRSIDQSRIPPNRIASINTITIVAANQIDRLTSRSRVIASPSANRLRSLPQLSATVCRSGSLAKRVQWARPSAVLIVTPQAARDGADDLTATDRIPAPGF